MNSLNQQHCKARGEFPSPWDRIMPPFFRFLVWIVFFVVLYILRSFFLLIFFTFVFAYIQTSGVHYLEKWIKIRTIGVILIAVLLLSLLTAIVVFLIPKVKSQTELFVSQFATYIGRMDQELFKQADNYPLLAEIIPELKKQESSLLDATKKGLKDSPSLSLLQQILGFAGGEGNGYTNINQVIEILGGISRQIASITSAFLLSLMFSFLIVLDLPQLSRNVAGLKNTKLRFIYSEVADNIKEFSHVMGNALEAQLLIAFVNSLLTAIGIYFLGLGKHVAFLSVIVFFCSFIPVIGVFISSVPICLIALQSSGMQGMFLGMVMITIIHLIEGYILNPRIYGTYMRINPVIVLIILTIAGKLFHFWGLILGVPVCTYIFGYALKIKPVRNELS
ncbi:MAG: AI-2E family transporter [Desulfobacterales bacterium]|nr:AI-2E family transporter [Desulfobacterales bacterium]